MLSPASHTTGPFSQRATEKLQQAAQSAPRAPLPSSSPATSSGLGQTGVFYDDEAFWVEIDGQFIMSVGSAAEGRDVIERYRQGGYQPQSIRNDTDHRKQEEQKRALSAALVNEAQLRRLGIPVAPANESGEHQQRQKAKRPKD